MDERRRGRRGVEMEESTGKALSFCVLKGHSEEAKERGIRAADGGSEGSRYERKSREDGCGRAVFTGHGYTAYCGFVRQQL